MNPIHSIAVAPHRRSLAGVALLALLSVGLVACGGGKEKKPGQALASVNGEEITVLQLNDELQRANVSAAQQDQARKQLLQALVDRQLLETEALKEKLDRDPTVVQELERNKSLFLAQSYMRKRLASIAKPTQQEITDYFLKNPVFFAERKQFNLSELVLDTSAVSTEVKAAIDAAKSLDEAAAWMTAHDIKFAPTQVTRSTSDLPPEMSHKLLTMPRGQLFLVREGERTLLIAVAGIKDSPVTLETAAPQIGQFLQNQRIKEASTAEIARLRTQAKIEYLNKELAPDLAAPAAAAAAPGAAAADANAAGVAGLK